MINTFFRLLKLLKKRSGILYILGFFGFIIVGTYRQVFLALVLKNVFDTVVIGSIEKLIVCVLKSLGIIALLSFIQSSLMYLMRRMVVHIIGDLRKDIFLKIENLPIKYFKNRHSGNLISRMTNDIKVVERALSNTIFYLVYLSICAVAVTVFMFFLDFWLAVIALVTGVIAIIFNAILAKPLRVISKKIQERLGDLTGILSDLLAGITVIKVFNLYKNMASKFANINRQVYHDSLKKVKTTAILDSLNVLGKMLDTIGVVGVGSYFVFKGKVSIGTIIAIWQLKNPILNFFNRLSNLIAEIQIALAGAERIFEVMDESEEPKKYQHLEVKIIPNLDKAIIFENVDFGYLPNQWVLKNLSFEVKKGKKVALVGASGEGKSTIFKLLMGFYPPDKGTIIVDGLSLASTELSEIRKKIAYVPQNAYLFNGTIMENIRYGKVDATEEEIIRAAKIANAHDFITSFENGYHTLVGERGAQLSGGQRQRIAIARAVLKDAPILLLDEATSALDAESEYLVQEALDRLAEGRTTLIIAHRLSTIKNVDEILVIDGGYVKERGTHEELMAIEQGIYRTLYKQQYKVLRDVKVS